MYWIDAELRPHWNDRPVGTIKRRDVAQLLNQIADPPRNAPASSDHVRAIVSRLFRFGISQGIEAIEYNPAHGIERAKPAGQRHRVLDPDEVKRLWRVWEDEFTAMGRPLIGEQFKLRLLTAQRGGEVLHMLWSAIDLDAGLWTKAFQFRKRKPTDTHQHSHLVPLAPMAVAVLRKLKEYHERERVRKNAEYGGTWNGKKYGGWPREHISDWVFPSRTNPANSMANFFGKEDAVMKALAKVEDFDPHDLRRTASTWANATCPSPWVDRLLDHEIGGCLGHLQSARLRRAEAVCGLCDREQGAGGARDEADCHAAEAARVKDARKLAIAGGRRGRATDVLTKRCSSQSRRHPATADLAYDGRENGPPTCLTTKGSAEDDGRSLRRRIWVKNAGSRHCRARRARSDGRE